jgi:heme-degrading monooxygenase HmoA
MIVSLARFRSALSDDDVQATFEARADGYRRMPGLVEKLYLRLRDSDEFAAVYVWETEDDLERFRESELGRTIAEAYRVDGPVSVELADVRLVVEGRAADRRLAVTTGR